jgi:single-strand DNA-binding protein
MQSIHLIGNLTKDPEIKTVNTVNGAKPVCTFRVAVNRIGKAGGVDYFNVTTWEAQATNCHKYLSKGSEVAVQGEIRTSESEKDGVRRYFWEILADSFGGVKFLRSPNGATRTSDTSDAPQHAEPEATVVEEPVLAGVGVGDDDIPF